MLATTMFASSGMPLFPPHRRPSCSVSRVFEFLWPKSIHTSRKAWTACSHSSSLCAIQSIVPGSGFWLYQARIASTVVRVLPAPVGSVSIARFRPAPDEITSRIGGSSSAWNGSSSGSGRKGWISIESGSFGDPANPAKVDGKPRVLVKCLAQLLPGCHRRSATAWATLSGPPLPRVDDLKSCRSSRWVPSPAMLVFSGAPYGRAGQPRQSRRGMARGLRLADGFEVSKCSGCCRSPPRQLSTRPTAYAAGPLG